MNITSLLFEVDRHQNESEFIQTRAPIRNIPGHLRQLLYPKVKNKHVYLEAGSGKAIIFCHGLFGGIYNIDKIAEAISKDYRFVMPYLPMYDMPLKDCSIQKLGEYLESFIRDLHINEAVIIGSSMGGGAALRYVLNPNQKLKGLVLCGSSGLSTIPLSKGFFKRKNYEFVKDATQDIFYNRAIPPDEMIFDVFHAIQRYDIVLRSIRFTKDATRSMMHHELPDIHVPTLLVWGKEDPITPAEIAPRFLDMLPDARLHVIEQCGHVPTQEKPGEFMTYFSKFLSAINY